MKVLSTPTVKETTGDPTDVITFLSSSWLFSMENRPPVLRTANTIGTLSVSPLSFDSSKSNNDRGRKPDAIWSGARPLSLETVIFRVSVIRAEIYYIKTFYISFQHTIAF